MKIEAVKNPNNPTVSFMGAEGLGNEWLEFDDHVTAEAFVAAINAGQALVERDEWKAKAELVCARCGGKGVVSVPCPDAKPGSSITCGVLHYEPCPACTPAAERAERYGKLRDKLDEWTDADKWEQRRWDACQEFAVHNAENYDPEDTVGYVDALIAEFRKGEAKA